MASEGLLESRAGLDLERLKVVKRRLLTLDGELAVVLRNCVQLFPDLCGRSWVDEGSGVHLALQHSVGAFVGVDGVVVGNISPDLVV
jgi:hypothetical protein